MPASARTGSAAVLDLNALQQRLQLLRRAADGPLSALIERGIEREGLRATATGQLASTPHPAGLGSALTHPKITTDFAEVQLELITGVHTRVPALIDELQRIHAFVWHNLGDELLWPLSVPCQLPAEAEIPLGRYGSSHRARGKELYRLGLSHRYGARMQSISGVHYNFSLADDFWSRWQQLQPAEDWQRARDWAYLELARNFLRYHWVLLYLLGASPAIGAELGAADSALQPWPPGGFYTPEATSLRNGNIGYSSAAQQGLNLDYNSLQGYCDSLERAIREPFAPWKELEQGRAERIQLGNGRLQVENELYAPVRLKCIAPGLRPLKALRRHGVRHLEIRCVDLNPEAPTGIDETDCRILDLVLLCCLALPSPAFAEREHANVLHNNEAVVYRGRDLQTQVHIGEHERDLGTTLADFARAVERVAEELCADAEDCEQWRSAAARVGELCADPERTPSAQQLQTLQQRGWNCHQLGLDRAESHRDHWRTHPLPADTLTEMQRQARQSVREQQQEEQQSTGTDFEDWLAEQRTF